jgi:hypothetical protein
VISHLVDDHMVMKPAEGDQVVGIGSAALRPGNFVVWLEPVPAGAAVCCASAVAVEDGSAEFGWDDPAGPSDGQRLSVVDGDGFDRSATEDLFDR